MDFDEKELKELKELVPYKVLAPTPREIIDYIKSLKSQLDFIEEQNKYINKLENKITNLQEENKRLKEAINDDMTIYLKGLEDGKDKMKQCFESVYKSRIEKAIEYIKGWQSFSHTNCTTHNELNNLLEILQGVGKNE